MAFENFKVGEIVKGIHCGTFRIVEFFPFGGLDMVYLKEVHPDNHSIESASGHLGFTEDMITKLYEGVVGTGELNCSPFFALNIKIA